MTDIKIVKSYIFSRNKKIVKYDIELNYFVLRPSRKLERKIDVRNVLVFKISIQKINNCPLAKGILMKVMALMHFY